MYGLSADFSAEFLCGRTLDSVNVQSNVIHLCFSGTCVINAEGGPSEGGISIDKSEPLQPPISILYLYPLIDQEVRSALSHTDGTLSLVFEKGQTLHIHDTSKQYESYSIYLDGKMIVVV